MEIKRVRLFVNENEKSKEVENSISDKFTNNGFIITNENDFDLGIAIGGDGSFLRMVNDSSFKSDCLYVGINVGTLGFAQDISVDELDDLIEEIKTNNFFYEQIGIQSIEVIYDNNSSSNFNCLNEIVVRHEELKVLHMDLYVDDVLFEKFAGDGVLISTSFGSSAYNLSYGGSLVYNEFDTLQITPIAPIKNQVYHTIANSLILPANKNIKLSFDVDNKILIMVDGRNLLFENINEIKTSIDRHINVFRKYNYNYIKKINDKLIK